MDSIPIDQQDAIEVLSRVLQVVAFINIFSAVPGSLRLWKSGKTEGWPIHFFVIGLCGGLGMTLYGFLLNNSTLLMINALQVFATVYYIFTYLVLADSKGETLLYLAGASAYVAGLTGCYLSYDHTELDKRLNLIGSASASVFFLMNCSTVLEVINAVRRKSAQFDLVMLGVGLVNAGLWLFYGLLLKDIYLYGPNVPFLITGAIKVVLMAVYTNKGKKKKKAA